MNFIKKLFGKKAPSLLETKIREAHYLQEDIQEIDDLFYSGSVKKPTPEQLKQLVIDAAEEEAKLPPAIPGADFTLAQMSVIKKGFLIQHEKYRDRLTTLKLEIETLRNRAL